MRDKLLTFRYFPMIMYIKEGTILIVSELILVILLGQLVDVCCYNANHLPYDFKHILTGQISPATTLTAPVKWTAI